MKVGAGWGAADLALVPEDLLVGVGFGPPAA